MSNNKPWNWKVASSKAFKWQQQQKCTGGVQWHYLLGGAQKCELILRCVNTEEDMLCGHWGRHAVQTLRQMCRHWGRHAVRTPRQTYCVDTEADMLYGCLRKFVLSARWIFLVTNYMMEIAALAMWLEVCVFLCIKMNILKLVAAFIQLFLSKYYEKKSTLSPNEVTGMELEIIALAWNHLFIVLVLFLFFIHCFLFLTWCNAEQNCQREVYLTFQSTTDGSLGSKITHSVMWRCRYRFCLKIK